MRRAAAAARGLDRALDDRDAVELEPALDVQAAVDQQDALALDTIDLHRGTRDMDDGEIIAAGPRRVRWAPPVRVYTQIALPVQECRSDPVGEVLSRQGHGRHRGELGVRHVAVDRECAVLERRVMDDGRSPRYLGGPGFGDAVADLHAYAGLGRVLGRATRPAGRGAVVAGDGHGTGHEVRTPGRDGRLDVDRQRADARHQAHP